MTVLLVDGGDSSLHVSMLHLPFCLVTKVFLSQAQLQIIAYSEMPGMLFLSFFNDHTCGIWKLPGQGLNLSQSCNLRHIRHSCSNAGSLSYCTGLGIEPALPQRQA